MLGRMFGPGFLLPMLLAEEGREVKGYLDMHRRTATGAPGANESLTLARESASMRIRSIRFLERAASRGIAFRRADSSATSCMDSTTASPRTSDSSRA
jgi:hypothetical protein